MIRTAFLSLFLLSACATAAPSDDRADEKADEKVEPDPAKSKDDGGEAEEVSDTKPGKRGRRGRGRRGKKGKRGAEEAAPEADDGSTHTIGVRFHVMQSDVASVVNATLDEAGANALLEDVNEVWKQADIRFELESVDRVKALPAESKAYQALADEWRSAKKKQRNELKPKRGKHMWATVPNERRPKNGVDVYIHHHMLGLGGVWQCPRRAVIYGQFNPGKLTEPASGAVLAHELGHGLDLGHVPCKKGGNLMMQPCEHRSPDSTPLEPEQIATARAIAKTGAVKLCKRGEASFPED